MTQQVMMIGRIGSGKTTLKQRINKETIKYDKTQVIEFYDNIIDTPGEYLENRLYTRALIVTAAQADIIILVEDALASDEVFSYGFASIFNKPVIGVVTKIDLVENRIALNKIKQRLFNAGAQEIFELGLESKDEIEKFLKSLQRGR